MFLSSMGAREAEYRYLTPLFHRILFIILPRDSTLMKQIVFMVLLFRLYLSGFILFDNGRLISLDPLRLYSLDGPRISFRVNSALARDSQDSQVCCTHPYIVMDSRKAVGSISVKFEFELFLFDSQISQSSVLFPILPGNR